MAQNALAPVNQLAEISHTLERHLKRIDDHLNHFVDNAANQNDNRNEYLNTMSKTLSVIAYELNKHTAIWESIRNNLDEVISSQKLASESQTKGVEILSSFLKPCTL